MQVMLIIAQRAANEPHQGPGPESKSIIAAKTGDSSFDFDVVGRRETSPGSRTRGSHIRHHLPRWRCTLSTLSENYARISVAVYGSTEVRVRSQPRRAVATPILITPSIRAEDGGTGTATPAPSQAGGNPDDADGDKGALSRRLSQLTEQSIQDSGGRAQRLVQEATFSEELAKKLEERIKSASFNDEHAQAVSQANITTAAGEGTRDLAGAQPWSGIEEQEDAVLRMLNDKHKPLRGVRPAIPVPRKSPSRSSGQRLASARESSSRYSMAKDPSMSEEEREQMRKELKERFAPAARALPATIQGLANLANERIEDAIARGQFRNLPRGKTIERDYNASSPFIDTTEYLMNRIIQKQEIVPPWIEKQQELVRATSVFRSRLRADWRRHAARSIASRGGSLQDQIRRAEAYTEAERTDASRKTRKAVTKAVGDADILDQAASSERDSPRPSTQSSAPDSPASTSTLPPSSPGPFRDPAWEQVERSYQTLSINNLNSLTRSYNLMAPDLAKKPYFSLERELRACYADVGPQLAHEIRHRATTGANAREVSGDDDRAPGLLDRLGARGNVRLYESKRPNYGFKEFWRDLWKTSDRA